MTPHIRPLTSLRAFLALWVLGRHWFFAYATGGPLIDVGYSAFLGKGYLGVDGFFVLSGYILAHNYIDRCDSFHTYGRFLGSRLARIYPVHLFCLCAFGAALFLKGSIAGHPFIGHGATSWGRLIGTLLLVNSWIGLSTGWNDVSWSISAEWFAYLGFPIFTLIARSLKPSSAILKIIACFSALIVIEWMGGSSHLSQPNSLARLIPEFMLGVVLFQCRLRFKFCQVNKFGSVLAVLVISAGIYANYDWVVVSGLALFILAISVDSTVGYTFLSSSFLVYLGQISYSLYMVQRIPEAAYRLTLSHATHFPLMVLIALLLSVTLICAMFVHHFVETPFRSFVIRWLDVFATRKTAAASCA